MLGKFAAVGFSIVAFFAGMEWLQHGGADWIGNEVEGALHIKDWMQQPTGHLSDSWQGAKHTLPQGVPIEGVDKPVNLGGYGR